MVNRETASGGSGTPVSAGYQSHTYHSHICEHPEIDRADIKFIMRYCGEPRFVLDVGCGAGSFLSACQTKFPNAVGLDISAAAARSCAERGLTACVGDGTYLPFRSDTFDVVRAMNIIEHLYDPVPLVQECLRILRGGGLFIVRMPTHFSIFYPVAGFYDDYTHVRPLTRKGLRNLLEDVGFAVVFVKGHTPGRNPLERLIAAILKFVFPRVWVALARKQPTP